MPTPSLTLARRLYARKHGVPLADVAADLYVELGGTWLALARLRSPLAPAYRGNAKTEAAALRKLCRALGWKP